MELQQCGNIVGGHVAKTAFGRYENGDAQILRLDDRQVRDHVDLRSGRHFFTEGKFRGAIAADTVWCDVPALSRVKMLW